MRSQSRHWRVQVWGSSPRHEPEVRQANRYRRAVPFIWTVVFIIVAVEIYLLTQLGWMAGGWLNRVIHG